MKIEKNNGVMYNIVIIICWPIFKCLYRFSVVGAENIPRDKKCIICPNHTSNADPVLLVLSEGRKVFFMAKAELFKNKIISFLFKYFGAFPIKRGKSDRTAIDKSNQILENGNLLAVFIEGTRSLDGNPLKPKSGAAMIAFNTKTPIIPVCISSEDGKKVRFFKKTKIRIGEPMELDDLGLVNGTLSEFRNASRLVMNRIIFMKEKNNEEFLQKKC